MICADQGCGCAIESETLSVTGSGTPDDPWVIEQVEFTDLTALQNDVDGILSSLAALPDTYVDVTGDTMTGPLTMVTAGGGIIIRRTDGDGPFLEFQRAADSVRIGYLQGNAASGYIVMSGSSGIGLLFRGNDTEVGRVITAGGIWLIGKTSTGIGTPGTELMPTGSLQTTRDAVGPNFRSNKISTGNADGQIHFDVLSAGTTIGSITRATSSTTAFNTSSDENWKTNIVEMDDELALYWMRIVEPAMFEFISDPGIVHGGYIAQHVVAAWPESVSLGVVTPGYGDIADRTWDDEGNETTPAGVYRSWQLDKSAFVPFIHAGLRSIDGLVAALTARVEALENA